MIETEHTEVCRTLLITMLCVTSLLVSVGLVLAQGEEPDKQNFLPLVDDPIWQWGEAITNTLSPPPASAPRMTIDAQGQVHLLWDTNSSDVPQYIYHVYLTATTWTSPTYIAYSLGISRVMFPPVVGPDGKIHFLWTNERTSGDADRMLYVFFEDGQWHPVGEGDIVHQAKQPYYSLQGMVHLDDGGGVHATFVEGWMSADIYHHVRTPDGWSSATQISPPAYMYWIWPDQHGGVRFYGNDYRDVLHYYYWRDGEYVVYDRTASGIVDDRQSQLDVADNLNIYWEDLVAVPGGSVNGLYYQCLDSDLDITPEAVLSGQRNVSNVVKAFGEEKSFALAWQESPSGTVKLDRTMLAVWRGCMKIYQGVVPVAPEHAVKALAISDTPGKVCLLATADPSNYEVTCADVDFASLEHYVYLPFITRGVGD